MINLSDSSEGDVVGAFEKSLSYYVKAMNGEFGSRSVTLRKEKEYPSDRDFAILFKSEKRFSIRMFGLQFKKWSRDDGCWKIPGEQLEKLREMNHVIAYCLPRPALTAPENALHCFNFVNPRYIPENARKLLLRSQAYAGIDPDSAADKCKEELSKQADLRLRFTRPPDEARTLREVLRNSNSYIKSSLEMAILEGLALSENADWGTQLVAFDGGMTPIPHCSWGEFFECVETGGRIVTVPGEAGSPPDPSSDPAPQDIVDSDGIGLTMQCDGSWGSEWAMDKILQHLEFWTNSLMEPPAAFIAYESFSRSLTFISYLP